MRHTVHSALFCVVVVCVHTRFSSHVLCWVVLYELRMMGRQSDVVLLYIAKCVCTCQQQSSTSVKKNTFHNRTTIPFLREDENRFDTTSR